MSVITPADSRITVSVNGKISSLPAEWYATRTLNRPELRVTPHESDEPLFIRDVGEQQLIRIKTNVDGTLIIVNEDAKLLQWDGHEVYAGNVRQGTQLRGRQGMYVVGEKPRRTTKRAIETNATEVNGIFILTT